ncbi:MAG: LysR substrate-binding domain-containing protein [Myxococcota bacterium]
MTSGCGGDGADLLHEAEAVHENNAEALLDAATAGLGIVQLPLYIVRRALDARDLVEVLPGTSANAEPIWSWCATTRRGSRRSKPS